MRNTIPQTTVAHRYSTLPSVKSPTGLLRGDELLQSAPRYSDSNTRDVNEPMALSRDTSALADTPESRIIPADALSPSSDTNRRTHRQILHVVDSGVSRLDGNVDLLPPPYGSFS